MGLSIDPNIHPLFMDSAYYPLQLLANSRVSVYAQPDVVEHEWDPDAGLSSKPNQPIWRGWSNVTPNVDWRARNREWGEEITGVHAYRVQLMHIDKNELIDKDKWGDPNLRVSFAEGMRVQINDMPTDKRVEGLKLVIRNSMTDSLFWQPTLLCDIETGDTNGAH